jgi:PIN domain nuclease of toxin-antitoxin system
MSRYLIDTHVFIWQATDAPQLSATVKEIIDFGANLLLSYASIWEIKVSLGKLSFDNPFPQLVQDELVLNQYSPLLPIDLTHVFRVSTLPYHHKDPFDRLLIAQAAVVGIPILSADVAFDAYDGVQCI